MDFLGASSPQQIGPFRTVAVLGEGGMGQVLLGVSSDGRLVAVKQVHADLAEDDGFRARFGREVAASRKVSGAYTAPVLDAGPDAPTPWLASAFVPGPSLSQVLATIRVLPVASVRQLAAGLAHALIEVHREGLIHRDLKPSNVLLAEDGVRVIDFGIARAAEGQTQLTHAGAVLGSPPYMSPEQVHGRQLTAASDMFSLGATLAVACTGLPPFPADSVPGVLYKVAHSEPELSAVPPELYDLIAPCLAKEEADRPSAQELLRRIGTVTPKARPWPEAVHRFTAEQRAEIDRVLSTPAPPIGAAPPPPPMPATPPTPGALPSVGPVADRPGAKPGSSRRRRTAWAVAAGAVVVALAVTAVLLLPGLDGGDDGGDDGKNDKPAAADTKPKPKPSEEVPTPGTTPLAEVRDKYKRSLPACEPAHSAGDSDRAVDIAQVPSEFGPPSGNGVDERDSLSNEGPTGLKHLQSMCVWKSRSGDEINVMYELYKSAPGGATGAEQAKAQYEGFYHRGGDDKREDIGVGEEALWSGRQRSGAECVLYVRDANVWMFVSVSGGSYPRGKCESLTKSVADGALKEVRP